MVGQNQGVRRLIVRPVDYIPPPRRLPAKKWRDLIRQVWHTDPLRCPKCRSAMRVIALIDDPRIMKKILRHLGAWSGPSAHPQARPPLTNLGQARTSRMMT